MGDDSGYAPRQSTVSRRPSGVWGRRGSLPGAPGSSGSRRRLIAWSTNCAARSRPFLLLDLDGLASDLARAVDTPSENYFTELLDVQILPLEHGGHAVSSAYDPLVVDAMRALQGRFHRHASAWVVRTPVEAILAA